MTDWLLLQTHPVWLYGFTALIGVCVGSFINVVIYRVPKMLLDAATDAPTLNLAVPRSHCPHCQKMIPAYDNIPLLSYLLLRGRCRACRHRISPIYFGVELLSGVIAVFCMLWFGNLGTAFAAFAFSEILLALIVIDIRWQLLPDSLTLPLLWLGLLVNLNGLFSPLGTAVIGAAAGYLSLWLLTHGYYLMTRRWGMGHGDFKLFAALGAWFGWQALPIIIIIAAVLGIVIGGLWLLIRRHKASQPIPFGPFLAVAGWGVLLWQERLLQIMQSLVG